MLQVSPAALLVLKQALDTEREEEGHVFRLDFEDDQFVLHLEDPREDDIHFEHVGEAVLAAPREVATSLLDATTIDLESTEDGPKLVLVAEAG
jgi:hypothetical protein